MNKKPTYEELKQRAKNLEGKSIERKPAEESIRQGEERYRKLINEMLNGFALHEIICDEEGKPYDYRFLDVNKAFEEMTGLKAKDIIGKTVLEILPKTEQYWIETYGKVALSGNPVSYENYSREIAKYFEVLAYSPKTGQFVTVFTDVTKRKEAQDALRESKERFRSIMESMKNASYICSSEYRIEYMSPRMISRIGRDAVGELCYKVMYNNDEKCSWCIFDRVQQGEYVEYELKDPQDNNYYDISNSPIYNTDGSISKLTIVRDITRVKKMEEQIQQAQKMEAIAALSGGIAHQFNNALSAITGNVDLLEIHFSGDENVADYAKKIKDPVRRMTQLTAQLLAYARGGKYQAKTVSLNDFVRDTLPLVNHKIDPAIHIDIDLPRDMLNVEADLTQMQMVLSAVLTNASEAMDGKGCIRVTCRNMIITNEAVENFPGLKPGEYVNLTITDDGKGMDEETRKRIFEPFFTTKFHGRGLGMAAVYGIVKNHDGWISVDSEPGKGTGVKIYLPAIHAQVKEPEKPKTERIKGTGTILVIEDDEMVITVCRAMLEGLGYRVLEAKTGHEAINCVKTFDGDINLAILDIILPDMSGKAVYPFLMEARPNLKVIVSSGYSIDGPAKEILDAGAQDFIQKPFTMTALSETLKKLLEDE